MPEGVAWLEIDRRAERRDCGVFGRWLNDERTPLAGLALVGIATLFAVWVSLAGAPNAAQREAVIGALGGGVYLVGVILAGLGTALALRLRRPNGVQTRRGAGVLALLAAAWGIAGAMSPEATLGGVSLAENSLGGDVGAALATGRGAIVIALLVLGGVALIAPQFSRSAALMGGRLMRSGGRELAARGPGVGRGGGRRDLGGDSLVFPAGRRGGGGDRGVDARGAGTSAAAPSRGAGRRFDRGAALGDAGVGWS